MEGFFFNQVSLFLLYQFFRDRRQKIAVLLVAARGTINRTTCVRPTVTTKLPVIRTTTSAVVCRRLSLPESFLLRKKRVSVKVHACSCPTENVGQRGRRPRYGVDAFERYRGFLSLTCRHLFRLYRRESVPDIYVWEFHSFCSCLTHPQPPRSTELTTKSQEGTKEVPSWEGIQGWVWSYDKKLPRA